MSQTYSEKPVSARRRISKVRWIISFCVMLPLIFVWCMFLSKRWMSYKVISASMVPTLQVGDCVIMKREKDFSDLVNQIIVFQDPTGGSIPLTKRVVAEQNSFVYLRDGHVYVDKSSTPVPGERIDDVENKRWSVGPGQVFVLGDNRNNSMDSIDYGPVDRSRIQGVLTYRYWPWSRRGSLVQL